MIGNTSNPNKNGSFSAWAECDFCQGKGPRAAAHDRFDACRAAETEARKDGWLEVELGQGMIRKIKNLCQWCAQAVETAARKADEQPYEAPT